MNLHEDCQKTCGNASGVWLEATWQLMQFVTQKPLDRQQRQHMMDFVQTMTQWCIIWIHLIHSRKAIGDSSISLFKAVRCCLKYGDNMTLNTVLQKARSEKWTENELNRMQQNIMTHYIERWYMKTYYEELGYTFNFKTMRYEPMKYDREKGCFVPANR